MSTEHADPTATTHIDPCIVRTFVDAARATAPDAPTACRGWCAHDLLAHVVAGGAEIARLIGDRLAGRPDGPTASFERREPPFRALPYDDLVSLVEAGTLGPLLEQWEQSRLGTLEFTGWRMDARALARHVESELAIHRWDLDPEQLPDADLRRPDLTAHAVASLNALDTIDERVTVRTARMRAAGFTELDARLRSPDVPDVHIQVSRDDAVVEFVEPHGDAVSLDAADRLLLLWGRTTPLADEAIEADPGRAALRAWLTRSELG